jgi:UDP-N-acetylglucosamine transferase subunit ALG13
MIFVTVGSQMPFDRLVEAVDGWVGQTTREVLAQIGDSQLKPKNMRYVHSMPPSEYADCVRRAELVVAHAGMGSIITALEFGKPILIMPRRGSLNETRNEHQVATARQFVGKPGIYIAMDEDELCNKLDQWSHADQAEPISSDASVGLLQGIRQFLLAS